MVSAIISGGYFLPISAENEFEEKQMQCIDQYIFIAYDYLQRENHDKNVMNLFMTQWMERCFDYGVGFDEGKFLDRVSELGY